MRIMTVCSKPVVHPCITMHALVVVAMLPTARGGTSNSPSRGGTSNSPAAAPLPSRQIKAHNALRSGKMEEHGSCGSSGRRTMFWI